MENKTIAILIGVVGLSLITAGQNMKLFSRGYRNNNPLNIRLTNIPWRGKVPNANNTDGVFEQFESVDMGYRAAAMNILNYDKNYNIFILEDIIRKWSPENGVDPKTGEKYTNATNSYIQSVLKDTGFDANEIINITNVADLVWAMGKFENSGPDPYSLDYVREVIRRELNG